MQTIRRYAVISASSLRSPPSGHFDDKHPQTRDFAEGLPEKNAGIICMSINASAAYRGSPPEGAPPGFFQFVNSG